MSWQIRQASSAFAAFSAEWDRLNREIYQGHPLFDSRFIGALLACFGQGDECLCSHASPQGIDGALILRPLGLGRWALFLPAQLQAGPVLVRDAALLSGLFASLPGNAWSIDLLALDPSFSPDWANSRIARSVVAHACTMTVSSEAGFDAYWHDRPKHLKQNLERYERRSSKQYRRQRLVLIEESASMAEAVGRYAGLEGGSWKKKLGTAVGMDNAQGRFYQRVLTEYSLTHQACVAELYFDDALAASRLMIHDGQTWIMLKTAYDESLAPLAPGRQLLRGLTRRILECPAPPSIEFYTDASRDQKDWATSLRPITHHQIFRNDFFASVHGLLRPRNRNRKGAAGRYDLKGDHLRPTVSRYRSVAELPAPAKQLLEVAGGNNAELLPEWFDNLEKSVFADDDVRYYVAELGGIPRAVLPVRRFREGTSWRIESLANYYTTLYCPILAPGAGAVELSAIVSRMADDADADVMRFSPIDPESRAFDDLLSALRGNGFIPFRYFCHGNWLLEFAGTPDSYFEGREGALRHTLHRKGKKFAEIGGVFEIVTTPAGVGSAIGEYNAVYADSWKNPEPYPEFMPGLARWLAERGMLRLGIARLGGNPVAAQLWIVHGNKAGIYKLAHRKSAANLAVGTLLTGRLMEFVLKHDAVTEVDYLVGDEPHKRLWMNKRRERWGIVAHRGRSPLGLFRALVETASRAQKWLRSNRTAPTGARNSPPTDQPGNNHRVSSAT